MGIDAELYVRLKHDVPDDELAEHNRRLRLWFDQVGDIRRFSDLDVDNIEQSVQTGPMIAVSFGIRKSLRNWPDVLEVVEDLRTRGLPVDAIWYGGDAGQTAFAEVTPEFVAKMRDEFTQHYLNDPAT